MRSQVGRHSHKEPGLGECIRKMPENQGKLAILSSVPTTENGKDELALHRADPPMALVLDLGESCLAFRITATAPKLAPGACSTLCDLRDHRGTSAAMRGLHASSAQNDRR